MIIRKIGLQIALSIRACHASIAVLTVVPEVPAEFSMGYPQTMQSLYLMGSRFLLTAANVEIPYLKLY